MENQKQLSEKEIINGVVYGIAYKSTENDTTLRAMVERFAELHNIPKLGSLLKLLKIEN